MKTRILLPATLVALVALGGAVATAQTFGDPGGMHGRAMHADYRHGSDHDGMRGMRGGAMGDMLDAVDADGDGQLTVDEIAAYRAARIAEADTSGDGALSLQEFETLYQDMTRRPMVRAFQSLDADGDGSLTEAELDRRMARMIARMDRDGDGVLALHGRHHDDAEDDRDDD